MKYGKWIVAAALSAPLFASPVFADDDYPQKTDQKEQKPDMKSDDMGTKVELKDVPAAVQKTLREQSQNKTLGDIRKVSVAGKTLYKAEITSGGKSTTIDVTENGKVTGRHEMDKDKANKEMDKDKDKAQQPQAQEPQTGTDTGNDMDHK